MDMRVNDDALRDKASKRIISTKKSQFVSVSYRSGFCADGSISPERREVPDEDASAVENEPTQHAAVQHAHELCVVWVRFSVSMDGGFVIDW